jgi:hypothetical protein
VGLLLDLGFVVYRLMSGADRESARSQVRNMMDRIAAEWERGDRLGS